LKRQVQPIFFLLCFAYLHFSYAQNDISIIQKDDSSIQFSYTPKLIDNREIDIEGKKYSRFFFSKTELFSKPGEPNIPVRTFLFAVPQNIVVSAELVTGDFIEDSNIDLVPAPHWSKDEVPIPVYQKNYQNENLSEWFPESIIELEKPSFMGDIRVVRIHLNPIQYLPDKRLVRRYNRIEVRLNFDNSGGNNNTLSKSNLNFKDEVLLKALQNPDQAKRWIRSKQKTTLKKRNKYFSNSDYYKIPIETEGLFRITGKFLKESGIDILSIDPSTIKILNNGGRILPRNMDSSRPDSLIENEIQVFDGSDSRFDESDYILFYGTGVNGWQYSEENERFNHYINPYTYTNIYWLTFNDGVAGKRIDSHSTPTNVSKTVSTYGVIQFVEDENYNIFHSGLVWFGAKFDDQVRENVYSLNFSNLVQTNRIKIRGHLYSSSGSSHKFRFFFDGESIGEVNSYGIRTTSVEIDTPITISGSEHNLKVEYTPSSQISVSYLDWFEIQVKANLNLIDSQLYFHSEIEETAVEYQIGGAANSNYYIFDVTNFSNIKSISDYSNNSGILTFRAQLSNESPRKFVIVGSDKTQDVASIFKDESSDLRNPTNNADFVIITHNDFFNAASSLKNLRESQDGLKTNVVKIDDVFDEFSAGLYDPTAIRDFLKYTYENWTLRPRYVLLFGDGDYDYKNIKSDNDLNWIPPYETSELNEIENRTIDDWFTYVNGNDYGMDFAIGRIPVQTTEEAEYVVDKLVEYSTNLPPGFWKNLFTIVADDEIVEGGSGNETIHTHDAEELVESYVPKRFDLNKIYLTEYPIVYDASASWISKPGVTEDLLNRINEGSLIINFIGHGNPHLWTHERIFRDSRDTHKIQNENRYGFWITATCDFGRWDDPSDESFAEVIFKMKNRGAIGMLTSARLVYASSNATFNKNFVKYLFQEPENPLRVGDAMRLAKAVSGDRVNREKFHIFGDPTLKLAVPSLNMEITELKPDSLRALSLITVKGSVLDQNHNPSNLSGQIYLKTFDSRKDVSYSTKVGSTIPYKMPGNPIFRGAGSADNGQFDLQFIVPKDITYGGKTGRISIYFQGDSYDGAGFRDNLIVDGTATDLIDTKGPKIEFEAQNQSLVDFTVLNNSDNLKIVFADDKSGINITGDVGHKIVAIPDENSLSQKEITYLFEYDTNSYLKGAIQMPLSIFTEFSSVENTSEMHQLTIKAWDNANNSSLSKINFEIVSDDELTLRNVLNYPNPFLNSTSFTFYLNTEALLDLKIYTLSGRMISHFTDIFGSAGFNIIPWDGQDQDGDQVANGVYLYKIQAKSEEKSSEFIGKMVKIE